MKRRTFLSGVASSLLTLPITRRLRADGAPAPKRLVLILQNNGTQRSKFWPTSGFTSPILAPLVSDPNIASRTAVIDGIQIPNDANGTNANQHDMGFARLFTGEKLLSVGGSPWGGGPSIDQIIAKSWGEETLALGVIASVLQPFPKPSFEHRRAS